MMRLEVGEDVVEQLATVLRCHREVVSGYSRSVKRLHAEDIPSGPRVGEDAGVGDAEALKVVGQ